MPNNTVGSSNDTESAREAVEGSCPRPSYGRAKSYGGREQFECGRLGTTEGPNLL